MLAQIIKKQPRTELPSLFDGLFNELNNNSIFFDDFNIQRNGFNLLERDDSYVYEFSIPGLKKDKLNIFIDGEVLDISYEDFQEEDEKILYQGFQRKSNFNKRIQLRKNINKKEAKTEYIDGILRVSFSKERNEEHRIPLKLE